MIIKSLYLKNFRQYKGEQRIDFSLNKEHNVTIFLGINTSGKTTLLQAFNWCLYGKANFETKDFLLNKEIAEEMNEDDSEEVLIEIDLIHNNTEYIISRKQVYVYDSRGVRPTPVEPAKVSFKKPNGETKPIKPHEVEKVINTILPKDLFNYFFFDTERIETISSKQDVTEAVKGLLGLSVLDNTLKHLKDNARNNLIKKLKNSMDLAGNQKAEEALKRMQSEQEKKEAISEQLDNIKSEIMCYEKRKEQVEGILRENESTADLQKKRDHKEQLLHSEKRALEEAYASFITHFNNNTTSFFMQPLMEKALDILSEAKIDDKGIKGINVEAIDEILGRGVCICGTHVEKGNYAYNNLVQQREYLPPQSLGTIIRSFTDKLVMYNSNNSLYFKSLKADYENISKIKITIQNLDDEIESIGEQIKDADDMKKYEQELLNIKKRLREFNEKKDRLLREDGVCTSNIQRFQKIYDSNITASELNKQIMIYIKYAEEIYNWIEEAYRENEYIIREKLEERVNKIFAEMYHGKRKVTIDEKYRVELLTVLSKEETKTDESKGLETVKNFAFIAGLVELAKEKIQTQNDNETVILSSEPYPLIMDAPFSNADEIHVSNISKVLPKIAEQVIMFVMDKDWSFAKPVMGYLVGKRYRLEKISETCTLIKEGEQ